MKILLVGSGGREHAICKALVKSKRLKKLYVAPGNGGMASIAEVINVDPNDHAALIRFVKENGVDLTVIGPEAPLVAGIVDAFEKENLLVFGPSRQAARLEGSKIFSKKFMQKAGIPTADYRVFDNFDKAKTHLKEACYPLVIKADGLCAGKGVVVAADFEEARASAEAMLVKKKFGQAGTEIIIEDCLLGEEASVFAISDGEAYILFPSSQDHKRAYDGDKGPNTGGMGAYSPAPMITEELLRKIDKTIIEPSISGMRKAGHPFKGVLYVGLMLTAQGPQVLEYNVRLGDPEAQAILPRLTSDFLDILEGACLKKLDTVTVTWDEKPCVCVVIASGGYPGEFKKDCLITGAGDFQDGADMELFHAGTKVRDGKLFTSGGRVFGLSAKGPDIQSAIENCYGAIGKIQFENMYYRKDIGAKALNVIQAAEGGKTE